MEKDIYTVEEVAQILDMHPRTIRRYIRSGLIKANKLGGQWRVRSLDLRAFMDEPDQVDDAIKKNTNDIDDFLFNKSNKSEGKLQVCTIVDYYVVSIEETQELCEKVMRIINSKDNNGYKIKFQYVYVSEEQKARFTFWGNPGFIAKVLNVIEEFQQ